MKRRKRDEKENSAYITQELLLEMASMGRQWAIASGASLCAARDSADGIFTRAFPRLAIPLYFTEGN